MNPVDAIMGGVGTGDSGPLTCYHPDEWAWAMDGLLVTPVLMSAGLWMVSKLSHDFFLATTGFYVHLCTLLISVWQVMEQRTHQDPFCTGFSVYTFPSGIIFVPWLGLAIAASYALLWRRAMSVLVAGLATALATGVVVLTLAMDMAEWWEALITIGVAWLLAWPYVAVMRYGGKAAFGRMEHVPWVAAFGLGNEWVGGHRGLPAAANKSGIDVVYATSWRALLYYGQGSAASRAHARAGGGSMWPMGADSLEHMTGISTPLFVHDQVIPWTGAGAHSACACIPLGRASDEFAE